MLTSWSVSGLPTDVAELERRPEPVDPWFESKWAYFPALVCVRDKCLVEEAALVNSLMLSAWQD